MNTRIINIDQLNIEQDKIIEAAQIIKKGGLLAVPTETVYGLGADATNAEAAAKIYQAKGRPSDNPLIVHIADTDDLCKIAKGELEKAYTLAEKFWPGPLTMILPKQEIIPHQTTGGLDTVAVRMPDFEITRCIIRESGVPLAAPSANISGRPSPTKAKHVYRDLNGRIDGIIDAGDCVIGLESTIVDLSVEKPMVLRPGYVMAEDLSKALDMEVAAYAGHNEVAPKAPGMKYRHYSPRAELVVIKGNVERKIQYISKHLEADKSNAMSAVICTEETEKYYSEYMRISLGSQRIEESIIHNIYAVLRELDEKNIKKAYIEDLSGLKYGELIMERLQRASGGNIIEI